MVAGIIISIWPSISSLNVASARKLFGCESFIVISVVKLFIKSPYLLPSIPLKLGLPGSVGTIPCILAGSALYKLNEGPNPWFIVIDGLIGTWASIWDVNIPAASLNKPLYINLPSWTVSG